MKNKLTELLNDSFAKQYEKRGLLTAHHTAEDLIANGVTIREQAVWIPYHDYFTKKQIGWICSNCSVVVKGVETGDTDFCPWCGAVMDAEYEEPPKEEV